MSNHVEPLNFQVFCIHNAEIPWIMFIWRYYLSKISRKTRLGGESIMEKEMEKMEHELLDGCTCTDCRLTRLENQIARLESALDKILSKQPSEAERAPQKKKTK